MRRLAWLAVVVLLTGAIAAWIARDRIGMALFERAATAAITRNVLAELGNDRLHVGFCGTGSPLPGRDRGEACTFVVADGRLFVFDAGEGAARTLGAMGLPLTALEGVWLTHLHSDHFNGLANLALQRWAGTAAQTPLPVAGPDGTKTITAALTTAYRIDSTYRIAHHGPQVVPPSGFGLAGADIAPGLVHDRDGVRITAFSVDHAPVSPAFGYRVDWRGLSVTITGDTASYPGLAKAAAGTDLLVSEVISPRMVGKMASILAANDQPGRARIMKDIQDYHISPEAAAEIARAAGAGQLAFTHIVPSVPPFLEPVLLGDARRRFGGPVRVMRDGDVISIGKGKQEQRNLID